MKHVNTAIIFFCYCTLSCGDAQQPDLPGEAIDCYWFSTNNCWSSSIAAFEQSLPEQTQIGSLSTDGKSCSYQDGTSVNFFNPVDPAQLVDEEYLKGFLWDFEIRLSGDFIMRYQDISEKAYLVQSSMGTFKASILDSGALVITCPDDTQYNVAIPSLLRNCDPQTLPGKSSSWDADGVLFTLKGFQAGVLLFNCITN